MQRAAWFALWLVLVVVAFGPAPPSRPDQTAWLLDLMLGRWGDENPLIVGEFWLMGVWPLLMGLLLRDHWRARPIPAWPFLLGSFALGCFALLPWFWLRREPAPSGPPAPAWAGTPRAPVALGVVSAGILAWALVAGDPADFARAFREEGFIWAMTFDFLAFTLVFAIEARRRAAESRAPWFVTLAPVVGAAAWLAAARRAPAAA